MITLTAQINLITSENGGTLRTVGINNGRSNVSSVLDNVVKKRQKGSNPFIFGTSILGQYGTFSNGENYYIGNTSANSEGIFENQYTITITGNNISALTIVFDDYNNQFPNSIIIDQKTYTNDDPIFTIVFTPSNTHTIVIRNWNTPNYPLRIQGIYIDLTIELNKQNLLSIDRSISDRADNENPSYGIISNTGNIEFNDLDGEIKDYAELNLLKSGLNVEIYISNTLTKSNELIGKYNSAEWNYDNDNRLVTLSIKDDLEEWQDINIPALNYVPTISTSMTLKDIYEWLYNQTPSTYNMLEFDNLSYETRTYLSNTTVQYPNLSSGTLWDAWEKLCQVAQAHIYKDNEGDTIFITTISGD